MSYPTFLVVEPRADFQNVRPGIGEGGVFRTYDQIIMTTFAADLVSYWRFQGNGTDQMSVSDATITGVVEGGVETIVDLDRVDEGAGNDGTVIAFSGTVGEYAQAASASALKTASGTIVVNHQHDTLSEKSTLVCGDSGGPAGGFSIEVNTDGSSRAYLRDATGLVVAVTGVAGDVQINQAYTTIFKWGSPGLSLSLWNANGVLIRRLTNVLSSGMTGQTSAIRFGAWHTDISHHDGPYGRVSWMFRRISDTEEADLARARTIEHVGGTPIPTDLPYNGEFYGNYNHHVTPNNDPINDTFGISCFFYAPRSGTVNRFRWNRRTSTPAEGYSLGTGGTYTCQIWPANASTKLPIKTGTPLSRLLNYSPRNDSTESSPAKVGGTAEWPVMQFSEINAPLVAGQPYCFEWMPTGANPGQNFVSMNGLVQYIFDDEAGPNSYATNMVPDFITNTIASGREFPFPVVAKEGAISWRKGMGSPSLQLRYADGIWFGNCCNAPGGATEYARVGTGNEARDRRRITLANRTVDGVWLHFLRDLGATGTLLVRLEDHGTAGSDTAGNGTLLGSEISVASTLFEEARGVWNGSNTVEFVNEVAQQPPYQQTNWVFAAFGQQHVLQVGRIYNLRFRKTSGSGYLLWKTPQGNEHINADWSPVSANWAEHEANHQIPWHDADSRGIQVSTDGTSWSWYGGNLRCRGPILYRCV